ncbi:MAG: polysaccharide deacetylase family protein [Gemmatimonadetes bacterium]|nr:polysaccharide deacetylase family protein [Gemmatimonadota bacterium]
MATQLRALSRTWKFVSPDRFAAMISGAEHVRGRNLLLTFDDGFASQRGVADRVLAPMGISAIFFVISDFVALQTLHDAREFVARNIQPGARAESLPSHLSNMDWSDLEFLLDQGHCIGGHTKTHARLSGIETSKTLEQEIAGSADTLEQRLGTHIAHFAYPFGDVASFGADAMAVARERFRFVYSGLRGENSRGGATPASIRRDAVSPRDTNALVNAYVEGIADWRYRRSRVQLSEWASNDA